MSEMYHTPERGGRSTTKLHPDRDCHYIREKDDSELVSGPRDRFAADAEVCEVCGG